MKVLIFDIETGTNENAKKYVAPFDPDNPDHCKFGNAKKEDLRNEIIKQQMAIYYSKTEKLFPLWAVTGKVLSIGTMFSDDDKSLNIDYLQEGRSEKQLLESFWSSITEEIPIVGFNNKRFDLPFLIKRSWINNVTPYPLKEGIWWKPFIVDLYDVWTIGLTSQQLGYPFLRNGLADVLETLGLETKDREMGKKFEKVFYSNREKAIEYATEDIYKTRDLFNRLEDFIRIKDKRNDTFFEI